jgi:hypothetical protein
MSIEKDEAPTHRLDHDEGLAHDAGQCGDADAGPQRTLPRAGAILGVVVLALAAAWATAYALGPDGQASASGAPPDPQIEALTRMGISPERANEAIAVQSEVVSTELASKITAALGDSYAGVWFQPAEAKFYIGVTSAVGRKTAEQVVAKSGVAAGVVVIQQVRSTWLELLAVQEQWTKKLAKLRANSQAGTAIVTQNNAVRIELSSSISAAERTALENEAAAANVNVIISVVPPAQLHPGEDAVTCSATFKSEKTYCEKTIVAGVSIGIGTEAKVCTAGPMLIAGRETYMLTTGHCFGTSSPAGGTSETIAVKSEYPSGGGLKEIGNEVTWVKKTERDMAIVKVKLPPGGGFAENLPTPVPALMAEWGIANPATPHVVNGQAKAETLGVGAMVCHEGMVGGEHCGVIKALNVTSGSLTEHLVETTGCAEAGDSGGPWFSRSGGEILILGIHVASVAERRCNNPPVIGTLFEPLVGLKNLEQYSILGTFTGKSLLTTANENRCP